MLLFGCALWIRLPAHRRSILILGLTLVCASLYWHWNDKHNNSMLPSLLHQSPQQMNEQPVQAEGVITSPPETDGDRVRFRMELYVLPQLGTAGALQKPETIMVQLKLATRPELQQAARWQRGDRIAIRGTWKMPGEARNFDAFDYRRYLRTQYIHWMIKAEGASALQPAQLTVNGPASWSWQLLRWNDDTRQLLGSRIKQIFHTEDNGYMKGLLIGDADDIDPEQFASFSRLGLTHILAISGLHVAIYTGLLLWLLRKLGLTRERACLVVMLLLPVYVLLTGASPSAIRAGIMGMIALYAASRGLLKDGLHILCAACWGMLLYEPYFLLNISFQLSFAVTAGLILYVPVMQPLLQKLPSRLAGAIAVTLVAQMISFPLTIYYFNQFSLLSFVANFLLVPVSSLIVLPVGSIALVLGYVWLQGAVWLGSIVSWINIISFRMIDWLDGLPAMLTIWHAPPLIWILLYYAALYILLRYSSDLLQWKNEQLSSDDGSASNLHTAISPSRSVWLEIQATAPLPSVYSGPGHTSYRTGSRTWYRMLSPWLRLRILGILLSPCLLCLLLIYAYQNPLQHGQGTVQYLDVGQGDSILITTPGGKHILVDGGGTIDFGQKGQEWRKRKDPYEIGIKLLVPLLKQRGIHQLDAVILTHGDHDHAGGLLAVAEQIPIRQFIFNGTMPKGSGLDELVQTLLAKKVPIYGSSPGMKLQPDQQTELAFLAPVAITSNITTQADPAAKDQQSTAYHPDAGQSIDSPTIQPLPRKEEQNHYSVVFLLTMNSRRFLFTGDADQTEEKGILYDLASSQTILSNLQKQDAESNLSQQSSQQPSGQSVSNPVDVLKIGHHGSRTSTSAEWLRYWQPALSVISVGQYNTYGHPTKEVLKRIEDAGSDVARTDQNGEVQIRVNAEGQLSQRTLLPSPVSSE
ncbi:hypothetical protein AR543_18270 [Paenibacillus bovis]|uniref:Metallo-beta-lactamase domain-containing protein n=1 Tax=Paenibacillus bovis TaxID=1616788 RepID=A0A172ZMM7_9BACL|nr:hypothetical protein AR543_18270 [Paenibacillus bovis]